MTYVVTENCIKCKLTDCVEVCPVDCFYETENMLVIDPNECIDCALCEPECPIDAISYEGDLAQPQHIFMAINETLAQKSPNITEKKPPMNDWEQWQDKPNKRQYLDEYNQES